MSPAACPRQLLRIMAAVDPDPTEIDRDALNALILNLSASMAEENDAELHIVHAWTLF